MIRKLIRKIRKRCPECGNKLKREFGLDAIFFSFRIADWVFTCKCGYFRQTGD